MRTTNNLKKLHDAVNCASTSKLFTQIPNTLIRDSRLSYKARGILTTLLSNSEGWTSHRSVLQQNSTDGRDAIESGLKELECCGYLLRLIYVNKITKSVAGSFWAYTDEPHKFDISNHLNKLELYGLEVRKSDLEKINCLEPKTGNPKTGNPETANLSLRIPIYKKNKKDFKNSLSEVDTSDAKRQNNINSKFLQYAQKLASSIQQNKNINITQQKIHSWAKSIKQLHSIEGVSFVRIKNALNWYEQHIGEEFVPVIESGDSFRKKFVKLENALQRESFKSNEINKTKQPTSPPKKKQDAHQKNIDNQPPSIWGQAEQEDLDALQEADNKYFRKHKRRMTKTQQEEWLQGYLGF